MRYLHHVSYLILAAGIAVALASVALELGALPTLIGLMMVVAGIVKIITVRIWAGFFGGEENTNP